MLTLPWQTQRSAATRWEFIIRRVARQVHTYLLPMGNNAEVNIYFSPLAGLK
jgi:hypothetical protein